MEQDLFKISIKEPTKEQFKRLDKGKGVRIYSEGNYEVVVDKKSYDRFHKNMKNKKGFTLKFNSKTGQGFIGDAYRFIKSRPLLKEAANAAIRGSKKYAHKGIDYLSSKAHQKIENLPLIGDGLRLRRPLRRRGKGIISTGAKALGTVLDNPILKGVGDVAGIFGLGMKPRRRTTRRGKGFLKDLAKKGATSLINMAAGVAKDKISGMGIRRRKKKASPAQLAALARGRAIRDANRGIISGSGRARKKTYSGSALYPAGY